MIGAAGPTTINNVRIWAAPENTRVVFDLNGPVEHKVSSLESPPRMILEISGATLGGSLPQPVTADRFVSRMRTSVQDGALRVVLEMKQPASLRSFQLPPNEKYSHRLVLDITGNTPGPTMSALPDKPVQKPQNATPVAVSQPKPVVQSEPAPAVVPEPMPMAKAAEEGPAPREVVVAVDAGHGGDDPGSIGPSGTHEKIVSLSIAKKLAAKINKVPGMRAVLIRDGDYFISLRDRIRKARKHKADLFVSIHADSFKDPKVSGSSVYVLSQRGASSEHAKWLAERENAADLIGGVKLEDKDDVLASVLLDLSQTASLEASIDVAERVLGGLKKIGNLHKKRVESAAFAVLKSPDIPSLLVETAYISNPKEEKRLLSATFQDTLTNAILNGLVDYFRLRAPDNTIMAMNREQEHVITRGDTLSDIARRYRVSIHTLRQVNGLNNDQIRIGQRLTIPSSGS